MVGVWRSESLSSALIFALGPLTDMVGGHSRGDDCSGGGMALVALRAVGTCSHFNHPVSWAFHFSSPELLSSLVGRLVSGPVDCDVFTPLTPQIFDARSLFYFSVVFRSPFNHYCRRRAGEKRVRCLQRQTEIHRVTNLEIAASLSHSLSLVVKVKNRP